MRGEGWGCEWSGPRSEVSTEMNWTRHSKRTRQCRLPPLQHCQGSDSESTRVVPEGPSPLSCVASAALSADLGSGGLCSNTRPSGTGPGQLRGSRKQDSGPSGSAVGFPSVVSEGVRQSGAEEGDGKSCSPEGVGVSRNGSRPVPLFCQGHDAGEHGILCGTHGHGTQRVGPCWPSGRRATPGPCYGIQKPPGHQGLGTDAKAHRGLGKLRDKERKRT